MTSQTTGVTSASPATQRQSDQAFDRIKSEIILCRLAPGTHFSEAELSTRLGLGRAATRAALTRLADTRLVQPVPRHGYIVTPITIPAIRELFELRLIVEPAAAALAIGKVDVARLRAINRAPQDARSEPERLAFLDSNRAFHSEIAAATGNRRLAGLLESLGEEMQRLVHLGLFSAAVTDPEREAADHEHEQLIEAIAAGDAVAAQAAARQHIEHSRKLVMAALTTTDWPVHGS